MAAKTTADIRKAASILKQARALVVTAGAGMGVDSGLPDFRGPEGFWRAYPPLKDKKLRLEEMSTPSWFDVDPEFAWGFFGHRYNLYSRTEPHEGFQILLKWAKKMDKGYFVFTSNVDGHFQKAGFEEDHVEECHGSINFLQCADPRVSGEIWPVPAGTAFDVDMSTLRAKKPLLQGPPGDNTHLARPNILMFGDFSWHCDRTNNQDNNFDRFVDSVKDAAVPFAVVEIGAGLAVPTVRMTSEQLVRKNKGTLIRINPNEPKVPAGHISLPCKGLEVLKKIDELMS